MRYAEYMLLVDVSEPSHVMSCFSYENEVGAPDLTKGWLDKN